MIFFIPLVMLVALWCGVIMVREKGFEAVGKFAPRMTLFTLTAFIPLLFDLMTATLSLSGVNAVTNVFLWGMTLVPITMSMIYALIIMTFVRNREKFREIWQHPGNSPDRTMNA